MNDSRPDKTSLNAEQSLTHLLEECRMVLPGIQAIFGFQLIAVFNPAFAQLLSYSEQVVYLAAIGLMTLAIGQVLTPASYHRLVEPQAVSRRFLRLSSHVLGAGMVCLMGGILIDVYLISRVILHPPWPAACLTTVLGLVLISLWFILPAIQLRK